jgi:hypothetical protein
MVRVKYGDVDLLPQLPKLWWFKYGAQAKKMTDGFLDFLFAPGLPRRLRGGVKSLLTFASGVDWTLRDGWRKDYCY